MSKVILLNVSGGDKPGLTSSLTKVLSAYDVEIMDIGQAVIHDFLSLGLLIYIPTKEEFSPVLEKFLFKAHELGLAVKFTPVSEDDYNTWVSAQGKQRHIITLLGEELSASEISLVTSVIAEFGLNIDVITRLSGRRSIDLQGGPKRTCVEFSVRGEPEDLHAMHAQLMQISHKTGVDIAFQIDDLYRRNRRLIVFDMDSTLIQAEVIDELARKAGVLEEVSAVTESAMRGEIEFSESLRNRVKLLEGLDESVLDKIADSIVLTDGASRLGSTLKALGYKTAILSGGFTYFGKRLQQQLGFDYMYANELEIMNGKLTGRCVGSLVDGERKAELLRELANKEGLKLQQTIAVGDGANDLPMLNAAGLGIAFHAKPIVKKNAQHSISTLGLDAVLYLIGVRDRDAI